MDKAQERGGWQEKLMNFDPASLDNLRDIVVPSSVPWWPPAPGWWVVFALLTLAIAVFAWRSWRAWYANAYRREALRELQAATSAAEVAEILKRTVLVAYARADVAAISLLAAKATVWDWSSSAIRLSCRYPSRRIWHSVLKAGETMDLADLAPSRMERARLKTADFAAERSGQPLGLVAYAGSAHLVLPPTRDTSVVATMAAEISPAIMPKRGDDLVGALVLAERTLGAVGGSVVVLADTVPGDVAPGLREFRRTVRIPIHFLAVAHANTPELAALNNAAAALDASVALITPDAADIAQLVRRTAKSPVSVASAEEGIRWAETGWWLVPAIAVLALTAFRRVHHPTRQEAAV